MSYPHIEVHGFKWPRRPTSVAICSLLGKDSFGCWLGVAKGSPWWSADRLRSGIFDQSLVKLVPKGTFWSVCFHPTDPVIDVDIILPIQHYESVLEEVDLEIDLLCTADGKLSIRDLDLFEVVRSTWPMPEEMVAQALQTCDQIQEAILKRAEPFGSVGSVRLTRFMQQSSSLVS